MDAFHTVSFALHKFHARIRDLITSQSHAKDDNLLAKIWRMRQKISYPKFSNACYY